LERELMTDIEIERRKAERRINTLAALEEYVNGYIRRIENRLSKWIFRGLIAFGFIALVCTASLVGFGVLLNQIQETRKNFIITNCTAQNLRHDKSFEQYHAATESAIKRSPQFAKQIKDGRADTENILNALVPKQNCKQLAKVALGQAKPPPPAETVTKERP
jgi:hypothetical protein